MQIDLCKRTTSGASVIPTGDHSWQLTIPPGPAGNYRLAQLDDYMHRPRNTFLWQEPVEISLQARVSSSNIPGTWGFGFWNDPFNLSLGLGGTSRRLPALPNTAWFFNASKHNYLSFRSDLPAQGFLAACFSSPKIPGLLLSPAALLLPLLAFPVTAKLFRRAVRRLVTESAAVLTLDVTQWHTYQLEWRSHCIRFRIDDQLYHETNCSPRGPLGLVIWIDNQFAAFPPNGRMTFGTLETKEPEILEIRTFKISQN